MEVGKLSADAVSFPRIKQLETDLEKTKETVEVLESAAKQESEIKRNLKAERAELIVRVSSMKK